MTLSTEEQKNVDRWMSEEAAKERKVIWRAYNDAMNASGLVKSMAIKSDFLTEEEVVALTEWADEMFWMGPKLSGIVDGAVEAVCKRVNDRKM